MAVALHGRKVRLGGAQVGGSEGRQPCCSVVMDENGMLWVSNQNSYRDMGPTALTFSASSPPIERVELPIHSCPSIMNNSTLQRDNTSPPRASTPLTGPTRTQSSHHDAILTINLNPRPNTGLNFDASSAANASWRLRFLSDLTISALRTPLLEFKSSKG